MTCPDEHALVALAEGAEVSCAAHVNDCPRCRELVAALTAAVDEASRTGVPARIGRFAISRAIGRGGMGVVYEGRDPTLGRPVAVKLVRGSSRGLNAEARERLLREAQGLARIHHPNVVQVFEAGFEDGELFIVMELVSGDPLGAWLAAGERRLPAILNVFADAGRGLAAAHAQGLVHRDFKPGNVLVGPDGVRVVDFGLVRAIAAVADREVAPHALNLVDSAGDATEPKPVALDEVELSERLTATGGFVGTPVYAAPEQLRCQALTERADIFSFGVALYEALYGHRPFAADRAAQLVQAVERDRVVVPTRAAGSGQRVPGRVRRILRACLRARPEDRPATIDRVVEALQAGPRRARVLAAIAASAATASAVAVLVARATAGSAVDPCQTAADRVKQMWDERARIELTRAVEAAPTGSDPAQTARAVSAIDSYAARWVSERVDACRATALRREQSPALLERRIACYERSADSLAAALELLRDDPAAALGAVDLSVELLASLDCADPPRLSASARALGAGTGAERQAIEALVSRANARRVAGTVESGWALAEQAVERAEQLADPQAVARAHWVRSQLAAELGDHASEIFSLKRVLVAAIESGDQALLAAAAAGLADRLARSAIDADAARDYAQQALAALVRTERPRDRAIVHIALAGYFDSERNLAESGAHADAALAEARSLGASARHLRADALLARGRAEVERRDLAAALRDYREALALREAIYGTRHIAVAAARFRVASALRQLGRAEDAKLAMDQAAEVHEQLSGEASEFEGLRERALAATDPEQQLGLATRALQRGLRVFGRTHPDIAGLYDLRRSAYSKLGKHRDAVADAHIALVTTRQLYPDSHEAVASALAAFSRALELDGQRKQAISVAEEALAIVTAYPPPNRMDRIIAVLSLLDLYVKQSDWAGACPLIDEVVGHPEFELIASLDAGTRELFAALAAVCDWELERTDRARALAHAKRQVNAYLPYTSPGNEIASSLRNFVERAEREP